MTSKFVVGILLIFGGVIALASQGIDYTTTHWAIDSSRGATNLSRSIPVPLILSALSVISGLVLACNATPAPQSKTKHS